MEDVLTMPVTVEIGGNDYQIEYNNKAYIYTEKALDKGLFKICEELIANDLRFEDIAEILYAGMLKHHTHKEIKEAKKLFEQYPMIIGNNLSLISTAYLKGMYPPSILQEKAAKNSEDLKKKTKLTKSSIG